MKKTEKIHIAGVVFHIDEDAYQVLKKYLSGIYVRFQGTGEGREIIKDVESRIAELLQEATREKDVVTMDDVNHVVELMGDPEDFEEAAEASEAFDQEQKAHKRTYKRLYRDPDNAVAGGVCSGLGMYFDIDAVIIRLLFVILFFISIGTALIIYLLLWIMIPRAATTAQKLEMRGERVDVSGIERRIKDEFYTVRDNVNRFGRSENYNKLVNFLNELGNGLYRLLKFVLKALGYVLGALLIFVGLVAVASLVVALLTAANVYVPEFMYGILPDIESATFFLNMLASFRLLTIGVLLVIGVPLVLLLYLGLRLVFRIRDNGRLVGITALVIWVLGIGLTVFTGVRTLAQFSQEGQTSERMQLETTSASAYHLKIDESMPLRADFDDVELHTDDRYIYWADDEKELRIRPEISVKPSLGKQPEIVLRKRARGKNRELAGINASAIQYSWKQNDSLLVLSPYFAFPKAEMWRFHKLELVLRLPLNSKVYLNDNLYDYLEDTRNLEDMWTSEMPGKLWKVREEGLALDRKRGEVKIDSNEVNDADIEAMKEALKNEQ